MNIVMEKMRKLDQAPWVPVAMMAVLFMLAGTQPAWSDDIRLKDGSLIKGQVIKETPGQNYTVRRSDGSEQVFQADQVESITKAPVMLPGPEAEPEPTKSRFRKGLRIGPGVGVSIPVKKDKYMGLGADLYPELQIRSDLGPLEIGLSGGYLYRNKTITANGHTLRDYTQAYVPLEFQVNVLPVRFFAPRFPVQPYVGVGFGGYIPIGDNNDSHAMVSPTAGLEFFLGNHNIIGLDYSFHYVGAGDDTKAHINYENGDLSYSTVMLCYRFRFPLGRQ